MRKITNQIILDYHNKGWAKIPSFLNSSQSKNIKEKINSFVKKKIKKYEGRDINFIDTKKNYKDLNSFHKLSDLSWIKKLGKSKKNIQLVKQFIGSEVEFKNSELFAKPKKKGLAAPDHQDNFMWCIKGSNALTMWIALDNANKKNGIVYYYEGSHKYGVLEHTSSYAKGTSQKVKDKNFLKKFKKTYPELKRGDALIHHSLIVHGSNKNLSKNSRQGLTFQYKDKKANYDKVKMMKYLKNLKVQVNARIK